MPICKACSYDRINVGHYSVLQKTSHNIDHIYIHLHSYTYDVTYNNDCIIELSLYVTKLLVVGHIHQSVDNNIVELLIELWDEITVLFPRISLLTMNNISSRNKFHYRQSSFLTMI